MERKICREVMVKEYVTRGSDGQPQRVSKLIACDSDKWTHEIKRTEYAPSQPSGIMVARTRTYRSDKPVCGNGHPMGGI